MLKYYAVEKQVYDINILICKALNYKKNIF